jgi:CHAT domain-containing protein
VNAVDHGLRIRIRIDPGIEEYAELMNLPWEFLYDKTSDSPIELMDRGAIIRDSITPKPVTSLEVKPPLKVLAVASDPKNYPPLRLGREKDFLQSLSNRIPNIKVTILSRATIDEVRNEMRNNKYHIFHFMGHGGFNKREKRCVLIFTGKSNKGISVNGQQLKVALADSVRLVFLNACETARIPEENPFAALPTELLLKGIPSVLSMQFPISDSAAINFCKFFYRHLAKGHPVDQCVREGRQQLFVQEGINTEWGTPVLFMRSTDGLIFKIK